MISLGSLIKRQPAPLLGLDISSSSVKLVELGRDKEGNLVLERCAIEPLERGWITDGNVEKFDEVAQAMRRVVKKSGTRTRNVAMALPPSAVITKKIILPGGLTEQDLEAQVEAEANQYIPFSLDEVSLDFCVVGPSSTSSGDVEVLIAASRKEKVDDRVAAAEAAGLKPMVMDIESYATQAAYDLIARQLPGGGRDQTVAIVDIGAAMTHINVLHNNQSVYLREQNFGGNQLTQEIQRRYSLSVEEAEIAKRQGGLPDNYEPETLQPFMDTLALEVARALQFFFSSTQFNRVDHILLAGGCAMIQGLDEVVASRTQVSTMIANPFANMALSSRVKPKQLTADAPALMIACGLALRRFDS